MEYNSNNLDLKNCSVRMGTIKDANKILKLINLIQPEDPWSYEHLVWQHFSSYGHTNLYLIENDDSIESRVFCREI